MSRVNGSALPVNTISSLAIGWGIAAGLHLAVGSPLGLPSAEEITDWITDLGVPVEGITRAPGQSWGVEKLTGHDPAGQAIELSVYGVCAENVVHGSEQQGCSPRRPTVMITDHVPAVRVPPVYAGRSVAAAVPA